MSEWPTWRATLCACTVNSSHTIATTGFSCSSTVDRVLDRERRARTARAEPDDRGVDLAGELVDLLAVARRGLADLRAGLDRDRLRAVAAEVLVPDARRSAATTATPDRCAGRS